MLLFVFAQQEAPIISKKYKNLEIITPGIRLPGFKQMIKKEFMTPKDAFKNKALAIVIGRSLVLF